MVFANAEYRFPLPLFSGRVFGAMFVDAGMVYESGAASGTAWNTVREEFRVTPGFGFRVNSPLGPMRFDIGYNPYPPQESPTWYGEILEQTPAEDIYSLRELELLEGLAPERRFFDRFRLHLSVGQAF